MPESLSVANATVDPDGPNGEEHDPALYRYEATADGVESLADVTDDHIRSFHETGYLVVRSVLTPEEVESGKQAIWDLIDGNVEGFKGIYGGEMNNAEC